jgi:UTP-glucose-1-phosphate uridylyltransferase
VDAVILAGGRGSRMFGATPEYYKPLLRVDGTPLVVSAVRLALAAGVVQPVVVVAPQNAEAIANVLDTEKATLIVQREPLGPGHALLLGLTVTPHVNAGASTRVLVLLSDNIMSIEDVKAVTAHDAAVGIRRVEHADAARFTRFENNRWVEKTPLPNTEDDDPAPVPCWVGPFVAPRYSLVRTLSGLLERHDPEAGEVAIGPHLNQLLGVLPGQQPQLVSVNAHDVGTIEAFYQYVVKEGRARA